MARTVAKVAGGVAVGLVAVFLVIQLVPYGGVTNPPVVAGPGWDSPQTEQLARRACYDCHSNEVRVPWYGHVAPTSWLVANHVNEARAELNLSEMNREQEEAHEAGEVVAEGEMPPSYYTMLHPEARLTDDERAALSRGLNATLGGEEGEEAEGGHGRRRGRGRDDEERGEERGEDH